MIDGGDRLPDRAWIIASIISAVEARYAASIYDDPERSSLGLLASGRVLITALNVIEAAGTEEPVRGLGLLRLERQLAQDRIPLRFPNKLLQEVILAHTGGLRE